MELECDVQGSRIHRRTIQLQKRKFSRVLRLGAVFTGSGFYVFLGISEISYRPPVWSESKKYVSMIFSQIIDCLFCIILHHFAGVIQNATTQKMSL